ncbi:MAG TPA: hypothetical protein VFD25_05435 [Clostridia bacterium]|nr:hypothetical protein [Clostridia bacterium]
MTDTVSTTADLRGYLNQIDETLKTVLLSLSGSVGEVKSVLTKNGEITSEANEAMYSVAVKMKNEHKEKFDELKSDIIRTADEVTGECRAYTDSTENSVISAVESGYVAKSEYGEYKSETNAALGVHDGRITANTEAIEQIDTDYREYEKEASSQISLLPSAIISEVTEGFISKDELEGESLESFIGSRVTQSKNDITEEFVSRLSAALGEIEDTHDGMSEYITETSAYIRRGELSSGVYGIEIGRSDSNMKTRFLNDKISFYQGEIEVAYISDNNLYITRAEVLDFLRIGNSNDGYFIFDVSPNGLEVRWSE